MGNFVVDDLADFLTSCGGVTTTIYRGFMPDTPDEAMQIVETGGYPSVYAFGRVVEERPTLQLMRRSLVANRARAELNYIKNMLDGFGDRNINGCHYKWISALQPPFPLGRDMSNREEFAMNILVAKAPSTATST